MLKQIKISSIKVGKRHRKDMGDLAALAQSIQDEVRCARFFGQYCVLFWTVEEPLSDAQNEARIIW